MIRETVQDPAIRLFGCDIIDRQNKHSAIFDVTGLAYSQLTHPYQLPYEDAFFDAIIGNGVLEHAANDYESLKEIYRVMQNDGYLIITFLPNKGSYTEFINEFLYRHFSKKHIFHRRRYSLGEIKHMLLHSGFEPIASGYHQLTPSLLRNKDV